MRPSRRQTLIHAELEALRQTLGRERDMPHFKELVAARAGPTTFAEIAEALTGVDVSRRGPEWVEEWRKLIETVGQAAESEEIGPL